MLLETKVRMSKKDPENPDREITEYTEALVNLDRVQAIFPSGVDGVLIFFMADKTQHLVKDSHERILIIYDMYKARGINRLQNNG